MRARALVLAGGIVLVSLVDLCLRGLGSVEVWDRNLPIPLASSRVRIVDLVRSTRATRWIDLGFSTTEPPPPGARLEVALASEGRTRLLAVRRGRPERSFSGAIRDVLSGRASLRLAPDRGWVDLGPTGDGSFDVQIVGLLPGPFGLEAPLDQKTGVYGDVRIEAAAEGAQRPRWRVVVPTPVSWREAIARLLFFPRHSAVLGGVLLLALGLFVAGTVQLAGGRAWVASVCLVSSVAFFHSALLPPLQGADETSHEATIELLVHRQTILTSGDFYPLSFALAALALEQDRVQFQPTEPLPIGDPGDRSRLAELFSQPLSDEATRPGPIAPFAGLQDTSRRSPAFFRAYVLAAPGLRGLTLLDRIAAYRLLAAAWGLALFAAGAWLLRGCGLPETLGTLYGLVALFPYGIATLATCSNYAPAIGLGLFLAAAACSVVLAEDPRHRRRAAWLALAAAWAGVFVWADFFFPALLGTAVLAHAAGSRLLARAGLPERAARTTSAAAVLLIGAASAVAFVLAAVEGTLPVKLPSRFAYLEPRTALVTAVIVILPAIGAILLAGILRRIERSVPDALRPARISAALAILVGGLFLLIPWTAVPYERSGLSFPRLAVAYGKAFFSNALAWDQDRLSWKFWIGVFGWHDAPYPDAVYAVLRWLFVLLIVSLPILAARVLGARPAAARALVLVVGGASACIVLTLALRHLSQIPVYGRYALPLLPLAALPGLALLGAPGRERALRAALFVAAALQVWTAVAVLGTRYLFAR